MLIQGAKIDTFGVGERLITAKSDPVFGGVYKLVAKEKNGEIIPKIKMLKSVFFIFLSHINYCNTASNKTHYDEYKQ